MIKTLSRMVIILLIMLSGISLSAEVYLGVYLTEYDYKEENKPDSSQYGLIVHNVIIDSPADEAKLRAGDVILKVDKYKLISVDQLAEILKKYSAGDELRIDYLRNNQAYQTKIVLIDKDANEVNDAYLGILTSKKPVVDNSQYKYGLRVDYLFPDSPLLKNKTRVGDIILSLNNEKLYTPNQLEAMLNNFTSKSLVELAITDNTSEIRTIKVQLKALPTNEIWQDYHSSNVQDKLEALLDKSKTFIFKYESQDDTVIGIEISPLNNDSSGVKITKVIANSPADKAQLQKDDVIVKIEGKSVRKAADVVNTILAAKAGDTIEIEFYRNDKLNKVQVEVVKRKSIFR